MKRTFVSLIMSFNVYVHVDLDMYISVIGEKF